jgi:hypothetical protein
LVCGNGNWTIEARGPGRITAADKIYMRKTAGYTWTDYKANTGIAKELNITSVLKKIQEYRRNRLQHTNRILCHTSMKIMKNDRPTGRRNQGDN